MANLSRNFTSGKMNKVVDERLVPNGEYIDALNIRMGSTENSEIGVIENTKGNVKLSNLLYVNGTPLSSNARCIGAFADAVNEKIYWFVHDPLFYSTPTFKLDMIVSYDMNSNVLIYHIISANDGSGTKTTLNFNERYLITGVNKIDDLIFFTDDYNPPRFFNVNRTYLPPVANVDQFSAESILVIKKPPVESPSINPIVVAGQENFLEENFICFAYRYKYADGEYSATSQWSEPSFVPSAFAFERDSFLNSGMISTTNGCNITYNSGGPLVVGIDLLFKSADSNVIKVIEKLNKAELGLANNTDYSYVFSNSKIFTILPESELLRLYDNVPRFAKAQTIMGNRLMYGNYVDGYDLIDKYGQPTKFEYETSLVSERIGIETLDNSFADGSYNIDIPTTAANSVLKIDFYNVISGTGLIAGAYITIDVTLEHVLFTGNNPPNVSGTTSAFNITFYYQLPSDYPSLFALISSVDFQEAIGTTTNIQPVPNAQNGTTFTDTFNDAVPATLALNPSGAYTKYESGISAVNQPILVTSIGTDMFIQFPAMRFVDNTTTPTDDFYEYYKVSGASVEYQPIGTAKSLHSNRDYDIGIVYMDEFNRATTALVSPNNTVYVPCGNSSLKNSIQVNIPATQVAPAWATRYKFVIKPNAEGYETIYTNIFYTETGTNYVWFLLEGENAQKVEVGDRYIVKADSNGPMETCAYATVLDKDIKASGVLGAGSPAGVYMKMLPTEFSAILPPNSIYTVYDSEQCSASGCGNPKIALNIYNQDIPSGTKISLYFYWKRTGKCNTNCACEKRTQQYRADFISSADYPDFKAWWEGDNIDNTLNNSAFRTCYNPSGCSSNQYSSTMWGPSTYAGPAPTLVTNYFSFEQTGGDPFKLWVTGTSACTGGATADRVSFLEGRITIIRAVNTIIFETLPVDSNPDIYYENDLSFAINTNGEHQGNVQNQVISTNTPAIVDTGFFNCFAFGNGAESYKVRDSIIGHSFNLGNRVTSVSAQDYKEADRYADMTYSGIYNNESNVNKLNEFNLGLLNFKPLENSFGAIYVLDGRETDVLVLQEDKISYVLAGKNLLSDAAAGGAITSVPEVLGTQIARVEKYGITFNPESYVHWGYDRFFTDSKRGAVIQLKGNSYSNDQLKVVSEQGMRTWFRDEFINSFNTQKLGGFDPYMNEYALSINDRYIMDLDDDGCVNCGANQTFVLSGNESNVLNYCIDLGSTTGLVTFTWNVLSASTGPSDGFQIVVVYGSMAYFSGFVNTSGTISFSKYDITIETAQVYVSMTGDFTLSLSMSCPLPQEMTIVEVVLTNNAEAAETTYAQYRYTNGAYTSPLQSRFVTFGSSMDTYVVSWYNSVSGVVGTGGFPPSGSTMRLYNNKISPTATFTFNPLEDKFKYHRSNILYGNNTADINTLLGLANTATPIIGTSPIAYADFTVPVTGNYLYLIWDYRTSIPNGLCYGATEEDACCNCESCEPIDCVTVEITNPDEQSSAALTFSGGFCDEGLPVSIELDPAETLSLCVLNNNPLYEVVFGNPIVTTNSCECVNQLCYYYIAFNTGQGFCYDPFTPYTDTSFAGWTIDGLDFATNYQSVIAGYGFNTTQILTLSYDTNCVTLPLCCVPKNEGVIVWTKSFFAPNAFIGDIRNQYGIPVSYSWSSAICEYACIKMYYQGAAPYTTVFRYLDTIGLSLPQNSYPYIDTVFSFGWSSLDISNPVSVTQLEAFLRTVYGPQVTAYSALNPINSQYELFINNVPTFFNFSWFFSIDIGTSGGPSGGMNFLIEPSCPPLTCVPDTLDFNSPTFTWTGAFNYDWTYVTQQVTGISYPIDIRVDFTITGTPQTSNTIVWVRRDATPPPYAITTLNTNPSTQGFVPVYYGSPYTLASVSPNEYLTFAVSINNTDFANVNFNVSLRNLADNCFGDIITTFEANGYWTT